jgi:hypothetical protein
MSWVGMDGHGVWDDDERGDERRGSLGSLRRQRASTVGIERQHGRGLELLFGQVPLLG